MGDTDDEPGERGASVPLPPPPPPAASPPPVPPWPPFGAGPPNAVGPSGRNTALIVVAVVAALGAFALVAVAVIFLLGHTASTTWSAVGDGAPTGMQHIPLPGDSDYTGTTSPGLEGTAVSEVGSLSERICSTVGTRGHSITPQPDFHPLTLGDAEQYAQLVVRRDAAEHHVASIELSEGVSEEQPDEDRLYAIGRRSAVLVCGVPDRTDARRAAATCTAPNGMTYSLYPVTVHLKAFELRTGRELTEGDVVATIPACPPTRPASATLDVSPAQLTGWVADHLKGGEVR